MKFFAKLFLLSTIVLSSFCAQADDWSCQLSLVEYTQWLPQYLRNPVRFTGQNVVDVSLVLQSLSPTIPTESADVVVGINSVFSNPSESRMVLESAMEDINRILKLQGYIVMAPIPAERLQEIFSIINATSTNIFITHVADLGQRNFIVVVQKWDR